MAPKQTLELGYTKIINLENQLDIVVIFRWVCFKILFNLSRIALDILMFYKILINKTLANQYLLQSLYFGKIFM